MVKSSTSHKIVLSDHNKLRHKTEDNPWKSKEASRETDSSGQMSGVCAKLITSMSALINNGALRECQQ